MNSHLKSELNSQKELNYSNNSIYCLPRGILLSEFPKISTLNISKNCFTEINESMVKSLPNLKELDAGNNKIAFITSKISLWKPTLRKLILCKNNIKEIPPEISQLENLKYLVLKENKIEYLPSEISELMNLKMLDVSDNKISSLPYDLGTLKNLKRLYMSDNHSLNCKLFLFIHRYSY